MCLKLKFLRENKPNFEMKSYELTAIASLAAISVALQIVHIGVSISYIWIDLVAIPWIIAFLIYGGRSGFMVSVIGALMIIMFAPFGFIGGPIKWIATMPMLLVPLIWKATAGLKLNDFKKLSVLLIWISLALVLRSLIIIPLDYYIAFPLVGIAPESAMAIAPWWLIAGLNSIQGVLEVVVAWLLVFKFRLDRFATWR
jgi:riboflavin transporter FmnP